MTISPLALANERGSFRFTKGSAFYSGSVVADPGFEIVRATFDRSLPLAEGFEGIQRHLKGCARPPQALCGFELRGPEPYATRPLFMQFNSTYVEHLRRMDLLVSGLVPTTRANLAIVDGSLHEQHMYAFLYTVPSHADRLTFATSATADLRIHPDGRVENVAEGDVSPAGLKEKVTFVLDSLEQKMRDVGASWDIATQVAVYTVHPVGDLIANLIVPRVKRGGRNGIIWHYTKPPVVGLEVEIDVRAVLQELII